MKGQAIVAIHKDTDEIIPISEATQTGLKCDCVCYDCGEPLVAVLNTSYKKHFRHSNTSNCNPAPESQLHLMAKAIIKTNNRIWIPGRGMVDYTDPVCEVRCGDLVPDATITVDDEPVYIEIVVTNPLHPPKIEKYRLQQVVVLVINLADAIGEMDEDTLKYMVLEDEGCRYVLSYPDDEAKVTGNGNGIWAVLIGLGLGAVILWNKLGRRGRKRRR